METVRILETHYLPILLFYHPAAVNTPRALECTDALDVFPMYARGECHFYVKGDQCETEGVRHCTSSQVLTSLNFSPLTHDSPLDHDLPLQKGPVGPHRGEACLPKEAGDTGRYSRIVLVVKSREVPGRHRSLRAGEGVDGTIVPPSKGSWLDALTDGGTCAGPHLSSRSLAGSTTSAGDWRPEHGSEYSARNHDILPEDLIDR